MSTRVNKLKKAILCVLVFATLISVMALSLAVFTDRINQTASITISTFDDSGYVLERTAPEGYFTAGENVLTLLKESNTQDTSITSQITMTVVWNSPVPNVYPWGNSTSENALITLGGEGVSYSVNADHSISFTLPKTVLNSGSSSERTLAFEIPSDLKSTGQLEFSFEKVELTANGWTGNYNHDKLVALDYDVGVAWNISKNQTTAMGSPNRDVIAILSGTDAVGEYGLQILKNGNNTNTNDGKMKDWFATGETPWADYTITELAIEDGVTTIGDYAFAEETGITSVELPDTITAIGTGAFNASGLTGELIIPASVQVIESVGFGNLPNIHTITFLHTTDSLTLPDNESSDSASKGAFYVPSYVETTINSTVAEIQYGYKWFNDNRRTAPMLNAAYSWRSTVDGNGTAVEHIALYDSTLQRITLLDYYTPDGTELKSWDASDPSVPGTVTAYICADGKSLILAGNGYGSIYTNPDSYGAFRDFGVLTTFENSNLLDTSKTTDMSYVFAYCSNLKGLDVSHFNTSNATTLACMFYEDYNLPELAVSEFDTGNVTNMMGIFTNCRSLKKLDVTKWDTRNVATMYYMFNGCSGLTELDLLTREVNVDANTSYISWDTSSVTNMTRMFINCTNLKTLKVSTFDTRAVTTMKGMFEGCAALPALDLRQQSCTANGGSYQSWDTSSVTKMDTMFKNCAGLESVNVTDFDTSNVEDMAEMFASCTSLRALDISSFHTGQCMDKTSFGGLYCFAYDCPSLTQITLGPNFGQTNTAHRAGSSRGMFFVGDPYTVQAPLATTVTGANTTMLAYAWSEDHRGFSIAVNNVTGGTVTANPVAAVNGQTITLTANADANYVYDGATITYVNETGSTQTVSLAADETTFIMPAFNVTVTPKWLLLIPILASGQNWYEQGGTTIARSSISSIEIKDAYTPATYVEKWDASDGMNGTVTAYVENDGSGSYKLTIAGNGYGRIYANKNSAYAFGGIQTADQFSSMTAFKDADQVLDTSRVTSMHRMFQEAKLLKTVDAGHWNTENVEDMHMLFYYNSALETLDVSQWDMRKVKDMQWAFDHCGSLTTLDVSDWTFEDLTNLMGTFGSCRKLTTLDVSNWNVSTVTNMESTFAYCNALTNIDVSKWDTKSVTNLDYTFEYCTAVTELRVGKWNTSNVTTMDSTFFGCENLTTLDVAKKTVGSGASAYTAWDTSKIKVFASTFEQCGKLKTLDVSNWNTGNAVNFTGMFYECTALNGLDVSKWNVSSAKQMFRMFSYCSSLSVLDVSQWVTPSLKQVAWYRTIGGKYADLGMFEGCTSLKVMDLSSWDMSQITNNAHMFYGCTSLTELTLPGSLVMISPEFAYNCTALTKITFEHAEGAKPTTPSAGDKTAETYSDAERDANGVYSDGGAFYVPSYLKTTIVGNNNIQHPSVYDWIADHRMMIGIDSANLAYEDVRIGYTVPAQLQILPENADDYQSIQYAVISGGSYASVDANTGVVTGKAEGTATIQVTIIDANGNTVTAQAPVKVYDPIPILAKRDTWFTQQDGTKLAKDSFTSIVFVDTYSPNASSVIKSWDASDGKVGTVTAYVEDDGSGNGTYKLTIAGNGYGKIFANTDSYNTFSYFKEVVSIDGMTKNGAAFFDTTKATTMSSMFNYCYELTSVDLSCFDTRKVTDFSTMFNYCTSLPYVDVSGFTTGQASDFDSMFNGCWEITGIDVSNWNMNNAVYVQYMFDNCDELTTLNTSNWVLTKVQKANAMFQGCDKLETLDTSKWSFSTNLIDTGYMFSGCVKLTAVDVKNWIVDNVTRMECMFNGCKKLTTIAVDDWNVGNVTDMGLMFRMCNQLNTLNVSTWDVSKVADMSWMFEDCYSLTTLAVDNWNVTSLKNAAAMFKSCRSLVTLNVSKWVTSSLEKVTDSQAVNDAGTSYYWDVGMFEECNNLAVIDISNWDMSKITNNAHMFYECFALKSLTVPASLTIISPEFAYFCTDLTSITFKHDPSTDIIFPKAGFKSADRFTSAGDYGVYSDGGAFYVPTYHETTFNFNGNYDAENYDWATDNRMQKVPVLAARQNWYTQGDTTVDPSSITSIAMVDTYNPSFYIDKWDASEGKKGTVHVYLEDDGLGNNPATYKLTIAGNGYGKIFANPDSGKAFYTFDNVTSFTGLTSNGIAFLDTSNVKIMEYMFSCCEKVTSLDVSKFNTNSVTNFYGMFYCCYALESLDVSNFNTAQATDMAYMFHYCTTLPSINVSGFDTSKNGRFSRMFAYCENLTSVDVTGFNTANATSLEGMFMYCTKLSTLDVTNFETSTVRDFSNLFDHCTNLTSLDVTNFNTANATSFSAMFQACEKLTELDVTNFVTATVTDIQGMFAHCKNLSSLDVTNFDTSNVTNMSGLFYECTNLTDIDVTNFDTSKAKYLSTMFSHCKSLANIDVTGFDTSAATTIAAMFSNCENLTSVDVTNFDTSNVTDMSSLFLNCYKLPSIDVTTFNTSKVTNTREMFSYCKSFTSLDLSTWDTSCVTNARGMFNGNSNLVTIYASDRFVTTGIPIDTKMFLYCFDLVGGNGTTFNENNTSEAYAHIDSISSPGYFTAK